MRPNHMKMTVCIEPLDMPEEVTFQQVLDGLNAVIKRVYGNDEERFGPSWDIDRSTRWYDIRKRFVVVFPVEGASEGYYLHVDTYDGYEKTDSIPRHLMTMKTFSESDRAQEIVTLVQWLLTSGTLR